MRTPLELTSKDVALVICFTALYAVFATIPLFQILGVPYRSITAAALTAPVIGILLGPYIGVLSTVLGGAISFFAGAFFLPSYISGIVAATCAGLQFNGKRVWCALIYLSSFLAFGFYPSIGPLWLFPLATWFQIAALLILVSPLQTIALRNAHSNRNTRLIFAFFMISLTSTMAGQVSGSMTYLAGIQLLSIIQAPATGWLAYWQPYGIFYPFERIIIALGSTFLVVPLLRVLRSSNLMQTVNRRVSQGKQK
jgi:hypothetical protein